jgi:hypothetical protein
MAHFEILCQSVFKHFPLKKIHVRLSVKRRIYVSLVTDKFSGGVLLSLEILVRVLDYGSDQWTFCNAEITCVDYEPVWLGSGLSSCSVFH